LGVHNDASMPPTVLHITANAQLNVTYVITSQPLHATYQAYPGMGRPDISIVSKDGTIAVGATNLDRVAPNCLLGNCHPFYLPVKLTVYGPAVGQIIADNGAAVTVDGASGSLAIEASNGSSLRLNGGYLDSLSVLADVGATVYTSGTTAQNANITMQAGSTVYGPAADNLALTLPQDCSDDGALFIPQSSSQMTVNGQAVTGVDQNPCINKQ